MGDAAGPAPEQPLPRTPLPDEPLPAALRFRELLAATLPRGEEFTLFHLKSAPTKTQHLVFTRTKDESYDLQTEHYFVLSHAGVHVLILEVYLYQSREHTTVFVSKADTSGHYAGSGSLDARGIVGALLRGLLRYYVPPHKPVRVSLFAKAEKEYLLLGSGKNPGKHILSDAQLVKWWTRCLDELAGEFSGGADDASTLRATLQIPGAAAQSIRTYLPETPRLPWTVGDLFSTTDDSVWAVRRIPRFPDDPKHRFLDLIVSEKRAKRVSTSQFWLELEGRQEFRLGTSVGVLGVEGTARHYQPLDGAHSLQSRTIRGFRELLYTADFSTLEKARKSSAQLERRIPALAAISVTGTRIPVAAPKRSAAEAAVNTLSVGLVRKKKK